MSVTPDTALDTRPKYLRSDGSIDPSRVIKVPDRLLRTREVAALAGVGAPAIRLWYRQGRLVGARLGKELSLTAESVAACLTQQARGELLFLVVDES